MSFSVFTYLQVSYICTADRQAWLIHPQGGSFAEVLDCKGTLMQKILFLTYWIESPRSVLRCPVVILHGRHIERLNHSFSWFSRTLHAIMQYIHRLITATGGQLASVSSTESFELGIVEVLAFVSTNIIAYCLQRVQIYSRRTIRPSAARVRHQRFRDAAYPSPLTSEGS